MKIINLIIISLLLSGCAGYKVKENGTGNGFDIYTPEPYLLTKPTEKGPTSEIIWLPNYNKRYRVNTWNFLSKADISFEITDGWKLSKISDKSDNTSLASKMFDIVQKATNEKTISLTGNSATLFRLVYDQNTGYFTGLQHIPINVPVEQKIINDKQVVNPITNP